MVCDLCKKNEAVIFLESLGKNGKRKINLCMACAMSRGIQAPVSAQNAKNLASVFKEIEEKEAAFDINSKRLCPVCGKSLFDILKSGLAGCPECYEVFKSDLTSFLNSCGISGPYTGSMPNRLSGFRNSLTDRSDLQAKLDEAVKSENYEKAAVYRDFLRALEKGSVQDGLYEDEQND
ncbi:MAG: UvrB/UvrC motif-containing protein [Treponema sp.]|nr:UvrB/UvrC motif-containing protein [Treponema sp.]